MFCSHCGVNNPDAARFCAGCGKPPGAAAAAPPQPQYQAPVPPPPQYQPPPPQYQQPAPPPYAPPQYQQPQYAPPPPPGYGAPPPGYGVPQMGAMPAANIATHFGLAAFSMIVCCLPLGAFALGYAQKVKKCVAAGDFAGAQEASRKAKLCAIWAMILGPIVTTLYVLSEIEKAGGFR